MQDLFFFITDHVFLSSLWLLCLVSLIFCTIRNFFLHGQIINSFEAIHLINKKNAKVIDTRSIHVFEQGHIVNAIHFSLEYIVLETFEHIKIYQENPILLIFSTTYQCDKYVRIFLKNGFTQVFVLKDGMHDWNLHNLPLVIQK